MEGATTSRRAARAGEDATAKIEKSNRGAVRATVYGGNPQFIQKDVESSQLPTDDFRAMTKAGQVIEPPFELLTLAMMEENSSELRQIIDAMEINIEGFGGRLTPKAMTKEQREKNAPEILAEQRQLKAWLSGINPRDNLTALRRKARRDRELTGNAYWELIPPKRGERDRISAISYVPAHTVRISKQDADATPMNRRVYDIDTGDWVDQTFLLRFRRFVQVRNSKKVWFKEYGDPRIVDRETGLAYADEASATAAEVPRDRYAHCLYHMKIHSSRTPYGLPRYVGNLFSIFGSRASDEINYNTFLNNNVPSMAIMVSGNAMLTEGTVKRINEFAQSVMKRSNNYSKFLILEAEPATEGGFQNSGTAAIKIERLKNEQQSDQLFQAYDDNNSDKVRRAFRLPPIFVGKATDYNRATADTSRKLAEEQVFAPEREEMDRCITMIFEDMGFRFWKYKSFGPNVTNDEDIVKVMNSIEKTGAMTPNLGRRLLADILNDEPELYDSSLVDFDPDVPFSLTMAEAVKGVGALGGNPATGALAPNQGQTPAAAPPETPAAKAMRVINKLSTDGEFEKLLNLFDSLDAELDDIANYTYQHGQSVGGVDE